MPRAAGQVLALWSPREGVNLTPSMHMLRAYVDWSVEEACKAQDAKARRQSTEHLPNHEDAPGSERVRNERGWLP
jgi:hypothetical protein